MARPKIALKIEGPDQNDHHISDKFREKPAEERSDEDRVISTVDGKLEQINIHNTTTFRIYPLSPASSPVNCRFPKELLEKIQNALGSFVSVSGECIYRPDATFPYQINVHELEALPPPEQLPCLSDLRGIAPKATGRKSPEQFVRELRDKWNEKDVQ